jgi:hypothetical protein
VLNGTRRVCLLIEHFPLFAMNRIVLCLAISVGVVAPGCHTPNRAAADVPKRIQLKLPSPKPLEAAMTRHLSAFEQQFQKDTGQTNSTPRSEFDRTLRIKGQSKDQLALHCDLSAWPEAQRKDARLWVGIGAPDSFTMEVNMTLTFTQNGIGITTPLNNLINIDGMALMGCDFAVQDGDVTIEIRNEGLPRAMDYRLHTTAYIPSGRRP